MITNGNGAKKVRTIVFDFDGTLAELKLDFADMRNRLARLAGEYLCRAPAVSPVPILEWSDKLAALIGVSNAENAMDFRSKAKEIVVRMELDSAMRGCLFPFTRPILDQLSEKGILTAIITRNCEAAVHVVFEDMDNYCTTFLARDHVPRVKPDPDHLFRALSRAGAESTGALIVGDHPLDVQTGKSAGIMTAGVWSGSASRLDLERCGADWVARDCRELVDLLSCEGRF